MLLRFLFSTIAAAVMFFPTIAGEPQLDGKKKLNFKELINQLASPNEEPTISNGQRPSVKFPPNYDLDAQKKVTEARQLLYDNFGDALPDLYASLDDERYSITINWADGDGYYNKSVGQVCENIIAAQLEVYRERIAFLGPRHWHQYTFPITKEWWEKSKNKKHVELQIECVEWAIERRKVEKGYDRKDRVNELQALVELRDELRSTQKPQKGKGLSIIQSKDR